MNSKLRIPADPPDHHNYGDHEDHDEQDDHDDQVIKFHLVIKSYQVINVISDKISSSYKMLSDDEKLSSDKVFCVFHHISGHLPRQIWFW